MPDYKSVVTPAKKKKKKKKQNIFKAIFQGLIPWKGDSAGEVIRKLVFLIAIATLAVALYLIIDKIVFAPQAEMEQYNKEILNIPNTITEEQRQLAENELSKNDVPVVNTGYISYYGVNRDFVGWITIRDTNINYPVVKGKDNDEYLHKKFDTGEYSKSGTIFADFRNSFDPTKSMSGQTILYGHNMRTDSFFTEVIDYRDRYSMDFLKKHPIIEFNTLYGNAKYKVFSVMLLNTTEEYGDVFDYTNVINFGNKDEFNSYCAELLDRSEYFTGVDLKYGDELLTLSTCEFASGFYDMRVVVVARKVREGENSSFTDEEIEAFRFNPDPKLCTTIRWAEGRGDKWAGRYWDPAWIEGFTKDDSFISTEQ